MAHILFVEDDQRLVKPVKRLLEGEGHVVDVAYDGESGLALATSGGFDAIILDVLLPKLNGIEVCRRLRTAKVHTPVIMLTARAAIEDRVSGLDAGADDYLTKPFAVEELLARLRALVRRQPSIAAGETLQLDGLTMDLVRHEVHRGGRTIALSSKEYALLEYFMRHPNQVLTRAQILDHVWGYDAEPGASVVEIYIHYLRNKIDKGEKEPLLHTVRGIGYSLRVPESA